MAKAGFGIVGAGLWGSQHARVLSTLPEAELIAVCDTDPVRAESVRARFGATRACTDVAELFADPAITAITVATPDFAHAAVIRAALQAGKHVMSEKPLATTVEESLEIAALAQHAGRKLMVDFHNRVSPPIVAARDAVASGELGQVLHVCARLSNTTFVPREMLSWAANSSALWFLGSHTVDALRFITGDEIVAVQAVTRKGFLASLGVDAPDVHLALLEFASGAVGTLENSWVLPPDSPMVYDFRIELTGDKGALQVSTADNGAFRKFAGNGLRSTDLFGATPAAGHRIGGFVYEAIARFVDSVLTDAPLLADASDGVVVTRVLAAIETAARTGQRVTIPASAAGAETQG